MAVCDPQANKNRPPFTVTFRSFTPQPNGLEFKPGQDYYFISALINQQDPQRRFSPCREHNMKVIFKVCCKPSSSSSSSSSQSVVGQPAGRVMSVLSSRRPNVVTLRPTVKPAMIQDYFKQQPVQPVTVLPIEVLPSSSDSASAASAASSSTFEPSASSEGERNEINDQPTVPSQPARQPPAIVSPPIITFDPNASPDQLRDNYGRYRPTPLPSDLTRGPRQRAQPYEAHEFREFANTPRRSDRRPDSWQLPPLQRSQVQLPSRLQHRPDFYPSLWATQRKYSKATTI